MKTKSKLFVLFLSLICTFALILSFGDIKKVIASTQDVAEKRLVDLNDIPSSQSIAANSLNAIAQKSHPYILYENSEITSLQNKIKSGYSKKAFDYITQKVKSYKRVK